MNRQGSMTDTHRNTNKKDPQKQHRFGIVSKNDFLLEGLNMFDFTNLPLISDVDQDI